MLVPSMLVLDGVFVLVLLVHPFALCAPGCVCFWLITLMDVHLKVSLVCTYLLGALCLFVYSIFWVHRMF